MWIAEHFKGKFSVKKILKIKFAKYVVMERQFIPDILKLKQLLNCFVSIRVYILGLKVIAH